MPAGSQAAVGFREAGIGLNGQRRADAVVAEWDRLIRLRTGMRSVAVEVHVEF